MDSDKATKNSQSETHEPWKYPGQTSQDRNEQPGPDVLEKQKRKKQDK